MGQRHRIDRDRVRRVTEVATVVATVVVVAIEIEAVVAIEIEMVVVAVRGTVDVAMRCPLSPRTVRLKG